MGANSVVPAGSWAGTGSAPRRVALPAVPATCVPRPALLGAMNEALHRRLTTVVAGPGGGKTTLLASWARTVPSAWYTLGAEDAALPVLARGLLAALRVALPGLGDRIATGWEPDDRSAADTVAAALADAVERECATDLALVVDDVQELGSAGPSVRLLESLCRLAPPVLHLVLSSRARPPFPVQRLRGRGEVLELDGAMLALGAAETEVLLAGVLGDVEPGSLARQVHDITDGWPAATHLAVQWLRRHDPAERVAALAVLRGPGGPLADYLAEEVFGTAGPSLQALLTGVAPLPWFTAELCQVLGVDIDEAELARLARGRLFVHSHPSRQSWYSLGALVRVCALSRIPPEVHRRVRRCAMSWFTDNGHLLEALDCAAALDEPDRTARFLTGLGRALPAQGNADDGVRTMLVRIHRAAEQIDQGSYGEAVRELDGTVEHAERIGYRPALAHGRYHRGVARLRLGRLDEAIADFEAAKTACQRIGSRDVALPLLGLAAAYQERGDLALARSAYTESVFWAERLGDRRILVTALAGLARVLVADDPQRAARLADRAVACGRGSGSERVVALLAAGWVALARGAADCAVRWATEAAEVAEAGWYRVGLAEALELRAAANADPADALSGLREAARIWADTGSRIASARNAVAQARITGARESEITAAEQRLAALGVRETVPPLGLLSAISLPCRTVQVRTLGGFCILRDGQPVRSKEWHSKKARDLLKLLISKRGRPTPREVLIETLWPAEDPARCANRLSVALSTVRAVLDPERRYEPDHFVHSDNQVVALTNLRIDVEEFLAAASRVAGRPPGRQVLPELRLAEALYAGDFLEEDPYEDWAVSLREQARAAYRAVAMTLADAAADDGDVNLAVWCYLRVLEHDPYDEQAHLRMTAVLAEAGRHGQARARYAYYARCMAELGIEPAPSPEHRRPPSALTLCGS